MGSEPSTRRRKAVLRYPESYHLKMTVLRAMCCARCSKRDSLRRRCSGETVKSAVPLAAEGFDLLLTDIHMPQAGGGFAIVSDVHHSHLRAPRPGLSRYAAISEALAAIQMHADEFLVKRIGIASLKSIVRERLAKPSAHPDRPVTQSLASILEHALSATIRDCLATANAGFLN
jgi:DNA-binding NarL/FixJ family response regulator